MIEPWGRDMLDLIEVIHATLPRASRASCCCVREAISRRLNLMD
jgi:hypothetical protein